MDELICPVCGQANPPEVESCTNCGSSLHSPIQPGQPPVKKHTSELEPILPDWLRDAREKSRQAGENEISEPPKKGTHPFGVGEDLLAGLKAQTEDEEADIPDWLANVTGTRSTRKEPSEPPGSRRVELSDFSGPELPAAPDFTGASDEAEQFPEFSKPEPQKPFEEDLKDWFRQATEPPSPPPPASPPESPENTDLDWLDRLTPETPTPSGTEDQDTGLPSWLTGAEDTPPSVSPPGGTSVPDWLKELGPAAGTPEPGTASALFTEETDIPGSSISEAGETSASADQLTPVELPDWLKELRDTSHLSDEEEIQSLSPSPSEWTPDETRPEVPSIPTKSPAEDAGNFAWLREMQEKSAPPELDKSTPAFDGAVISPPEDTGELDWLKTIRSPEPPTREEPPTSALTEEPDWFTQASTEVPAPSDSKTLPVSPLDDIELPAWLKDAAPGSLAVPDEQVELPDWMKPANLEPTAAEPLPAAEEALPDWLSGPAEGSTDKEAPEPLEPSGAPGWLSNLPALEETPAEIPDDLPLPALPAAELPSGGLDSLFTPMPDWLSETASSSGRETAASSTRPSPTEPAESLTPANLPSWVQAMRPVEASAPAPAEGEETLETQGPLAGLHGILPSLPYLNPARRPQAQSMKLDASTEQQNHGALLEQILQAEIHPYPVPAARGMSVQRGLRLAIGILLFLALLLGTAAGTQILPLPVGWSAETMAAVQAVESIPPGSPVLVVFDYEPSLAGEMEAAAAPLLDHIIIRSHPVLTLLSTSPTGTALADRLFAGPLQPLAYQDLINLGYLPGGLGGVRSFVQNPAAAMPLGADSTPAGRGVGTYSEYSAILVITDSLEGGRTWIEQAGPPWYTGRAFVVISSAQAGPMLQPYYSSGQINGLVSGLFDAAVMEQNNAGRPGLARRYWDAFNLGLALTVILIAVGAAWNLIAALRDQSPAEAG